MLPRRSSQARNHRLESWLNGLRSVWSWPCDHSISQESSEPLCKRADPEKVTSGEVHNPCCFLWSAPRGRRRLYGH